MVYFDLYWECFQTGQYVLFVGHPDMAVLKTKILHCSCSVCPCSTLLQGCMHEMKVELHKVTCDGDGADK